MSSEREAVRAWAAQWDISLSPMAHTVRRTRKEVMEYMADAWGARRGLTVQQAWARAYRRGCRIIAVEIRPLPKEAEGNSGESGHE